MSQISRMCACMGPKPGHTLCPCRELDRAADRAEITWPFMKPVLLQRIKTPRERDEQNYRENWS